MPELRRDPVVGYWTIVATERSKRPADYTPVAPLQEKACPFCEGREQETSGEIYALRNEGTMPNQPGWSVRVVTSKTPLLFPNIEFDRFGEGMYDLMQGVGEHELIIETPTHHSTLDQLEIPQIEKVIQVYQDRFNCLGQDPRYKYALLYKNHGLFSNKTHDVIQHSRSQLIALPITPKRLKEELLQTRVYYERRERCVFCDIIKQEKMEGKRVVTENNSFIAFCPFASRSPFEIWVLPKKHCSDFRRMEKSSIPSFAAILKDCLLRIRVSLNDPPYNTVLHTAPFAQKKKEGYWKTIEEDYHWYFQISPRLTRDAGFEWGTGIYINPTPPEEAASLLREVSL